MQLHNIHAKTSLAESTLCFARGHACYMIQTRDFPNTHNCSWLVLALAAARGLVVVLAAVLACARALASARMQAQARARALARLGAATRTCARSRAGLRILRVLWPPTRLILAQHAETHHRHVAVRAVDGDGGLTGDDDGCGWRSW